MKNSENKLNQYSDPKYNDNMFSMRKPSIRSVPTSSAIVITDH